MGNNNKPLYKVLNEERTQGEWMPGTNTASKEWMQIFCNKKVVLEVNTINKKGERKAGDFQKEDYNAKYTALAVNNLAHLAEALEGLMNNPLPNPNIYNGADYFDKQSKYMEAKDKAREALKRIS
jgi:hypothetical protein